MSTVLALHLSLACAKHGNSHLHAFEHRHKHHRDTHTSKIEKGPLFDRSVVSLEARTGKCQFPTDAGLIAVTPEDRNGGWAMSPDQCCEPGGYCPYACPPGQVMAQWDPDATAYTYPQSMVRLCPCHDQHVDQKELTFFSPRTEACIAIRADKSRNRSPTNRIASMARGMWDARTRPRGTLPFAKPFFPETKPC